MPTNPDAPGVSDSGHAEYPRPRLKRTDWNSLDGPWEFLFDPDASVTADRAAERLSDQNITVPFAYQTALSGINDKRTCDVVWYARSFTIQGNWSGRTVLLHFGAVDFEATVWVNGNEAGSHRGGYDPFEFDVTELLQPGQNRICVRVFDSQDPGQPRGKQASSGLPHGIDYWCTTGIWQSVWLEPVADAYLRDVAIEPTADLAGFRVSPEIVGDRSGLSIEIEMRAGADKVFQGAFLDESVRTPIEIPIAEAKRWSPNSPFLYEITVRLLREGRVIDEVETYAGMRSIEARGGSMLLNGEPIYLQMVLDQGYWPESGLTAPSGAALERDVLLIKQLGFNAARKHQKVEDPRWLHWCDVHGLMVWGEMANARSWSPRTQEWLESQWERVVKRDRSHPCIIAWVPVNESMGFPELGAGDAAQREGVERLVRLTRRLDPTRLVIDNDGWEQTAASDIVAIHDYSHSGESLRSRYEAYLRGGPLPERIWTGHRVSLLPGVEQSGRPVMLTEVGGFLTVPEEYETLDRMYEIYASIRSSGDLLAKYRELMEAIGSLPFLAGFCYTQLTDVEQEKNGLLTFDRQPKADVEAIADVHRTIVTARAGPPHANTAGSAS